MTFCSQVVIFYSIRVAIGMFSAVCETVFYRGVRKRFGKGIAFHTFLVLILAPGMFAAVTSYLPSSFAMNALMLSWGAWYTNNHRAAVLWAAFGTILSCWPFVLLISLPLALDSIRTKGFLRVLGWGVLALVLFLVPCTAIDVYFYRKPVIPLLNLFWYNVAGPTGGSTLYGVEPWYFYVLNGFLNFNYVFFFAALSLLVSNPQSVASLWGDVLTHAFLSAGVHSALLQSFDSRGGRHSSSSILHLDLP
jgi:alpha-1,2-mannosyltransferase